MEVTIVGSAVLSEKLKGEIREAVRYWLPAVSDQISKVRVEATPHGSLYLHALAYNSKGFLIAQNMLDVAATIHPAFDGRVFVAASELSEKDHGDPLQMVVALLKEAEEVAREDPRICTFVGLRIAVLADGLKDALVDEGVGLLPPDKFFGEVSDAVGDGGLHSIPESNSGDHAVGQ